MKRRQLGQLEVSAIGLGCMTMSPDYYGAREEAESLATLHTALDHGMNFWDTANVYGFGHNEELLSKVLRERRAEVVLATKFGLYARDGQMAICGRPDYVHEQCDSSLKRLGVEQIDLYYLHRMDREVPIEETVGAMAELVQAGKIKHIGLSEVSAETLRRAHAVHPITAVQSEYSLWSRDIEPEVIPTARELGVGIVPYSPLGRGFLTGQIRSVADFAENDFRRDLPRFQSENFHVNLEIVDELQQLAAERGVKAAQLALAWVLAQGENLVPIPGTSRRENLLTNIAAADLVLSEEELARINAVASKIQGERYTEFQMGYVNM